MKRPGMLEWEPGRGWRRVRGRVPARPRSGPASERVPRPPSFRFHAAGEQREPRTELQLLGVTVARELARELVGRFGGWPAALAAVLLWARKGKR